MKRECRVEDCRCERPKCNLLSCSFDESVDGLEPHGFFIVTRPRKLL